jgi:hypothetical protein
LKEEAEMNLSFLTMETEDMADDMKPPELE